MASTSRQNKKYNRHKLMCMIISNPHVTYREIADAIGISTGSAYNLMTTLISKGIVYFEISDKNHNSQKYCYKLSNIGIREKAILSRDILELKKIELVLLQEEIKTLELEVSSKL